LNTFEVNGGGAMVSKWSRDI